MGVFDHFPYTNFHELNLMWILEALKEIQTTTEQFVAINSLKYANPIQWNIVQQYEKNTIVIDPLTGTAYISVQAVPSGVSLSNDDYWTVVFDLGSFVVRAAKNFTSRYEDETTLTATFNTQAGEWLVWGDTLYVANVNITAGDSYVIDGNIRRITIEEVKNEIYTTFNNMIGDLADLTTSDKSNLVAAINEVVITLANTTGDLNDLNTTDKSNLVAAINEVLTTLINTSGDLADLTTSDKSNLVAAINEEITSRKISIENVLYDLTTNKESGDTYSSNYEAGQLFTKNEQLYKVIINVATGTTIEVGANCIEISVEDLINSIVSVDYKTISNSSGSLTHLIDVAKTYIDHSDIISYGNYNTLFSTNCTQVDGKWVIDCSAFVEACLKGITFENSRYNSNAQNILGLGYDFQNEIVSDPNEIPYRPYGMVSSAMYYYAELHGYNYLIDSIDRIQIGDIIFLANNPLQYKNIGHCGIVINIRKGTNAIVLLDADDNRTPVIQPTIISLDPGTNAIYAARFPLCYQPYINNNLLNNRLNNVTSITYNWPTGSSGAAENMLLVTDEPMKANQVYSFIMVLDSPFPADMELAIMALVNNTFVYLSGARFDSLAGGYIIRGAFYTPPLFNSSFSNNAYSIRLRAIRFSATNVTRSETLSIKYYGLYEGLSNEPIINNNMPASSDIITKSAPYLTESVVNNLTDLKSTINNFASNGIDWASQKHVIRITSAITLDDGTVMPLGRYLIEGISYANGSYGGFTIHAISGIQCIVEAAILNSNVSLKGVVFNTP